MALVGPVGSCVADSARAESGQALFAPLDDPDDIYWDNSLSSGLPGAGMTVRGMVVYDHRLLIGGNHLPEGAVDPAGLTAAWDGDAWLPTGSLADRSSRPFMLFCPLFPAGQSPADPGTTRSRAASPPRVDADPAST